jgi:hypothetical protein
MAGRAAIGFGDLGSPERATVSASGAFTPEAQDEDAVTVVVTEGCALLSGRHAATIETEAHGALCAPVGTASRPRRAMLPTRGFDARSSIAVRSADARGGVSPPSRPHHDGMAAMPSGP